MGGGRFGEEERPHDRYLRLSLVFRLALGGNMLPQGRADEARFEPSNLPEVVREFSDLPPLKDAGLQEEFLNREVVEQRIAGGVDDWLPKKLSALPAGLYLTKQQLALVHHLASRRRHGDTTSLQDRQVRAEALKYSGEFLVYISADTAARWRAEACDLLARHLLEAQPRHRRGVGEPDPSRRFLLQSRFFSERNETVDRAFAQYLSETLALAGGRCATTATPDGSVVFTSVTEAVDAGSVLVEKVRRHNWPGRTSPFHVAVVVTGVDDPFDVDAAATCTEESTLLLSPEVAAELPGVEGSAAVAAAPRRLQAALGNDSWPLVGREDVLDQLERAYEEVVQTGSPCLAVICGSPGMGKTRLVQRLAHRVFDRGGQPLYGRCEEVAGGSFHPFVEALSHHVCASSTADLRVQLGNGSSNLARLLPELEDRLPGLATATPGGLDLERHALFRSVSTMLERASWATPIVLILDDFHWADPSTLALLRHIGRCGEPARLLVAITSRDDGSATYSSLLSLMGEASRQGCSVLRVTLQGLSRDDVQDLVTTQLGPRPADFVAELHAQSRGNPLTLRAALSSAAEPDAPLAFLRSVRAEGSGDGGGIDAVDAIRHRVRVMKEADREVLVLASVLGVRFGLVRLARASGWSRRRICGALDEGTRASLVVEVGDGDDDYQFFDIAWQALNETLSQTHSAALHLDVAESILEHEGETEHNVPELAKHFSAAVRLAGRDRAIRYCLLAGQQAVKQSAFPEGAAALRSCARLAGEAGWDPGRVAELLVDAGEAYLAAGLEDDSRTVCREAAALAKEGGAVTTLVRAVKGVAGPVEARYDSTLTRELVCLLEDAIASLEPEHGALRPDLVGRLAIERFVLERFTVGSPGSGVGPKEIDDLISAIRATRNDVAIASIILARLLVIWDPDDPVEHRVDLAAEMLERAQAIQPVDRHLTTWARGWLAIHALEMGQMEEVHRQLAEIEALAENTDRAYVKYAASLLSTTLVLFEGGFADAREGAFATWNLRPNNPNSNGFLAVQLFLIDRECGTVAWLEDAARAFVAEIPAPFNSVYRAALMVGLSDLRRLGEARQELQELSADRFRLLEQDPGTKLVSFAWACETSFAVGAPEEASTLLGLLSPYRTRNIVVTAGGACLGSAELYLGLAASAVAQSTNSSEDWRRACNHLEEAVHENERMGAVPWAVRSKLALARALLARDATRFRASAERLMSDVCRETESLGMVRVAASAREVQADLSATSFDPR